MIKKDIDFVFTVVLLTVLYIFYSAYVLSILWEWFILPLGVIKIDIYHAIGVMLVFSSLKGYKKVDTSNYKKKDFIYFLFSPAILLTIGWLVK